MSDIFWGEQAISPRAQASDEGARSRVQAAPSHGKSGYPLASCFWWRESGERADAIDASLTGATNKDLRVSAAVRVHGLGATVRRLDDAQFFAVEEAQASGARRFEAELRGFLWFSAMIATPVCP